MALWSLPSLAPPRSFMWFGAAVPGWSSLDPRLRCKPPHLFPWSLSQLHPLLCREEGSTGCAKMPGYRGGTLTCSVLWAKGWHLCSGLLSLPWSKHTPDYKSLSLPSLLAVKSVVPSCLWLGTVPGMMLLKPGPAKEGSLSVVRYPFTSQRGSPVKGQSSQ